MKMKLQVVVQVVMMMWWLCGSGVQLVTGKVHVQVINGLGDGETVNVHCQSKDDDLGPHDLSNGQSFEWKFIPSLFQNTLFYCDVRWRDVTDFHFDAYVYIRDRYSCAHNCRWLFSVEGIYYFDPHDGSWNFRYPWRGPARL